MHHIQFIYIRYIHAITSGNAKSSGPTIPSWAHWPPRGPTAPVFPELSIEKG